MHGDQRVGLDLPHLLTVLCGHTWMHATRLCAMPLPSFGTTARPHAPRTPHQCAPFNGLSSTAYLPPRMSLSSAALPGGSLASAPSARHAKGGQNTRAGLEELGTPSGWRRPPTIRAQHLAASRSCTPFGHSWNSFSTSCRTSVVSANAKGPTSPLGLRNRTRICSPIVRAECGPRALVGFVEGACACAVEAGTADATAATPCCLRQPNHAGGRRARLCTWAGLAAPNASLKPVAAACCPSRARCCSPGGHWKSVPMEQEPPGEAAEPQISFNDVFSTRRPRDAKAGLSSGLKSIGKGIAAGVVGERAPQ